MSYLSLPLFISTFLFYVPFFISIYFPLSLTHTHTYAHKVSALFHSYYPFLFLSSYFLCSSFSISFPSFLSFFVFSYLFAYSHHDLPFFIFSSYLSLPLPQSTFSPCLYAPFHLSIYSLYSCVCRSSTQTLYLGHMFLTSCLGLSVYLSLCLSVYLSICLSIHLSICVCLSVCHSGFMSIFPFIYLLLLLYTFLTFYLSICLSVFLAVPLYFC
jgi:hypothetical protein